MRKTTKNTAARPAGASLTGMIVRRIGLGALMLIIVSFIVFACTQALPGDIARQVLGQNATAEQLANLREQLGLTRPLIVQYADWLWGAVRGDFGTSIGSGMPVADILAVRVQNSLAVVSVSLAIVLPLAVLLGTLAARRPGSVVDHVVSGAMHGILSLPEFVVGILVIALLATNVFRLFPPASILDPRESVWAQPELLVLPVVTMVLIALPHLTESVKTLMRDELASEHIRWARLSGIREPRILGRFALPSILPPTLQVSAVTVNYLLGGTVAVETVFSFPGIGSALVGAVQNRDIVTVQAVSILIAAVLLAAFVIADILGMLATPRLRRSAR